MWNWLPLAFFKTQQIWIELSCQTLCKQIFSQYSECSFFITYRLQSPTEYKFSPHLPHFKNDPRGAFIVRWSVLEKGLVRWIIGWWVRVLWCRSVDIISPWLLLKGKKVIHLVQKRCAHLSGRPCLLLFSPLSLSNGEQVSPANLLCLPMWSLLQAINHCCWTGLVPSEGSLHWRPWERNVQAFDTSITPNWPSAPRHASPLSRVCCRDVLMGRASRR